MFEHLTSRFQGIFRKIKRKSSLSEDDLKEISHEVKKLLLEADVNFKVVKLFIRSVEDDIREQGLLEKLNVERQLLTVFHKHLSKILGEVNQPLTFQNTPKSIMLVGLQGVGKTTTAAKLALHLRKKGIAKRPLLVGLDTHRPAATLQLELLSREIGVDFFTIKDSKVKDIARAAISEARKNLNDLVIYDTAGRLAINEEMMAELEMLEKELKPEKIIKVIDALSGQDIVRGLELYRDRIKISGFIFTKLDSDAKGGSILSVSHLSKLPIYFIGEGERLSNLSPFFPERITNRILNIGDIETLIENFSERLDQDKIKDLSHRFVRGNFTLEDLMQTLHQINKLGRISKIMQMIPGINKKINKENLDLGQKKLEVFKILLSSMTKSERLNPKLLKNNSRKQRIIKGSGRSAQDFNNLINSYESMMKQVKDGGLLRKMGALNF